MLQFGIGAAPDAIAENLHDKRDLGIHTGLLGDRVLDLIESGAVNNRSKPIRAGSVAIDNPLAGAAGSGGVDGAAWVACGLIDSISTTPTTSAGYASANTRAVKPPAEWPTTTYGPGISACCRNFSHDPKTSTT